MARKLEEPSAMHSAGVPARAEAAAQRRAWRDANRTGSPENWLNRTADSAAHSPAFAEDRRSGPWPVLAPCSGPEPSEPEYTGHPDLNQFPAGSGIRPRRPFDQLGF